MVEAAYVKKLRLKFPGDPKLLFNNLSISIEKGEKVLILGPSGCGKSTLLQVLSGLMPKTIEIPMKYEKIHTPTSWGYVFQDPDTQFCMPYTDEELAFVLENLKIPREEMPGIMDDLLTSVGLTINRHTPIQILSGGMKQRLALASILALQPDWLFLDEPTALLDEEGTKQIWDVIKNNADDKTVIIVEHKINHVMNFVNRVIVLSNEGDVIADGNVNEVFSEYKQELQRFGIWYPGVWEDSDHPVDDTKIEPRDTLSFSDYKGYRMKDVKVELPFASLQTGEWITVIGKNGAGKSTLLYSIMKLIDTTGAFLWNNKEMKKWSDIKDHIYFVFQNPEYQFITNSVFEELAFSLKANNVHSHLMIERVEELLHLFNLNDHRNTHPFHLSLGQKRRLSVATAFVENPKLLLLDEPTFGQDSKNTFKILSLLEKERQKGCMIIMVTHDLEIVKRYATRVWEVEDGLVIKDYRPDRSNAQEGEVYALQSSF